MAKLIRSAPYFPVKDVGKSATYCEEVLWVEDADALHAELVKRGATVIYGPIVQEAYHTREFALRDCDGHVPGFGHVLPG